jgi:hypothetical protein
VYIGKYPPVDDIWEKRRKFLTIRQSHGLVGPIFDPVSLNVLVGLHVVWSCLYEQRKSAV